jgi:hypothetical protein
MKKQSLKLIFSCVGGLLLVSGCAVTKLEPGAEKVVITDSAHAPSSCKNLGRISTFDTNGSSVTFTSHERLQKYQTGILKNKTVNLGGNVLVILDHETTYTEDHDVDTHLLEGNAYACSAATLQKIVPETTSDIIHVDE